MLGFMRAAVILLLVASLPPAAVATEAWRWVDPDGNVEYSDTPRPGAVRIELPAPRPVALPPQHLPSPAPEASAAATSAEAAPYLAIAITEPAEDDTVRDNGGNLLVSVKLEPPLQKAFGHRLQLLLDGEVHATAEGSNFALTELDRGTHILQASAVDQDGEVLATSPPVRFHLHRTNVRQLKRLRATEKRLETQRTQ